MSVFRKTHTNLAARMARWSAAHWKTATFGWLAFVLVAFGLGGMVGTRNIDNTAGPGESGRMDRILEAGFKQPASEHVLIQNRSLRVGTAAFDSAIADVVSRISKVAAVRNLRSPLAAGNAGQIAKDGHSALVEFQIRGEKVKAVDKIGPVLDAVAAAQRAHPELLDRRVRRRKRGERGRYGVRRRPRQGGNALAPDHANHPRSSPSARSWRRVFRCCSRLPPSSRPSGSSRSRASCCRWRMQAYAMVLLIGLAVGVDYSMFYLKRERQERAAGRSPQAALEIAAATSGRSVLISGLTVIVAMAGMFLTGDPTSRRLRWRRSSSSRSQCSDR